MRVALVASEAAPFVKTGGLGDVVGALPDALLRVDPELEVVTWLPLHRVLREAVQGLTPGPWRHVSLGGRDEPVRLWERARERDRVVFVDAPGWFDREALYGHRDGALRWAGFCRAVLDGCADGVGGGVPDVLHAHDWQASLALVWLKHRRAAGLERTRGVLTIHNLAYQGRWDGSLAAALDLQDQLRFDRMEWHGQLNYLKGGIEAAEVVTTVSPTYAREVLGPEHGQGLDAHLRHHANKLVGILNGLDGSWDPEADPALPAPFSAEELEGKAICREALARELGIDGDGPLLGVVARFTEQKGLDLVLDAAPALVEEGARLAVLGTGDQDLEDGFRALAHRFDRRVGVRVAFDGDVARRVLAGSDVLLMPSRFEPCGLTQMQAMRYGTVPVAHAVGGLRDTVLDPGDGPLLAGEGTGFRFEHPTVEGLLWATRRALRCREEDPDGWRRLMRAVMRRDWRWDGPAARTLEVYRALGAP